MIETHGVNTTGTLYSLAMIEREIARCDALLGFAHGGLNVDWTTAADAGDRSGVGQLRGDEYVDGVPTVRLADAMAHEYVIFSKAVDAVRCWYASYAEGVADKLEDRSASRDQYRALVAALNDGSSWSV